MTVGTHWPSHAAGQTGHRSDPAQRPRVSLIVDHPIRDLPGMVMTAVELVRHGATCLLTPFNLSDWEIWRQVPDFVLLNYYRKNLQTLYRQLARSHIGIGVLDTEGGVLESLETFARELVADPRLRQAVACYCCWGPRLADHLVHQGLFAADRVHVTGCPRTDVYHADFRRMAMPAAGARASGDGPLILVNSNFSIGNPAFLTDREQFELLHRDLGHPADVVRRWQALEKEGLGQLVETANQIAQRFPQATVVYRPHPFERMETYENRLERRGNLFCLRTGSVDAWILQAAVVIQRSCSTSIEAGMAGSVALMPNWISTPFEREAANRTSTPCRTPDELLAQVDRALEGRFQLPTSVRESYHEVIRDWFFQIDGRAHQRVAAAILDRLQVDGAARGRRARFCQRQVYGLRRSLLSTKRWRGTVLSTFGLPPTWSLRHGRDASREPEPLAGWRSSVKHFDASHVAPLVAQMLECLGEAPGALRVEAAGGDDYAFGYSHGCAVKIVAADPAFGRPLGLGRPSRQQRKHVSS